MMRYTRESVCDGTGSFVYLEHIAERIQSKCEAVLVRLRKTKGYMRILGLDYGSKTVGAAMTDPLGVTVQPLKTITRDRESKLRKTVSEIERIVSDYGVEKIVLGLPLNMNGTEGERAEKTRAFSELLKKRIQVPIIFEDERLTTVEASEILDESGIPQYEQKKMIDQVAAQLILEQYLNDEAYKFK